MLARAMPGGDCATGCAALAWGREPPAAWGRDCDGAWKKLVLKVPCLCCCGFCCCPICC